MLIYLIVGCALLGLIIGSFLNVVIYRVPQHLSLVSPNSFCPACSKPILRRDNVPVLSWLLLKGRCRSCGAGISARYPLVEILCAGLFAGAAARVGFNGELPALLILLSALLALASIDLDQLILPKVIVYVTLAGLIVALVADAMVTGQWHRLLVATICSASWFVIFFAINAFGPHLLGFGDVRLSLVLGFGLGWLGPWYVALGILRGEPHWGGRGTRFDLDQTDVTPAADPLRRVPRAGNSVCGLRGARDCLGTSEILTEPARRFTSDATD